LNVGKEIKFYYNIQSVEGKSGTEGKDFLLWRRKDINDGD
jgi:hypothetical protein